MHDAVKKYADSKDVKGLKYIFVDALDVDPTFEKYREDFDYCRQLGLFEPHREVSTMKMDSSAWDMTYWKILKRDLLENFSEKRLQHMMAVAKVIYAEKIKRSQEVKSTTAVTHPEPTKEQVRPSSEYRSPALPKISRAEQERQEVEEARRALAEENRRQEQEEQRNQERQQRMQKSFGTSNTRGAYPPKKSSGTVPTAVLLGVGVLAVLVAFLLLKE